MSGSTHRRALSLAALTLAVVAGVHAQEDAPRVSSIRERAGIALKLLDVNALDEEGRPLRGVPAEEFTVSLNGRRVEPYAIEDLCAEDAAERPAIATHVYLDLSQMLAIGADSVRRRLPQLLESLPADTGAIEIAIRRSRGPIEHHAALDREDALRRLTAALDGFAGAAASGSVQLEALEQMRDCATEWTPDCLNHAQDHDVHTRSSLISLARYTAGLAAAPGRKRLFYLYQTTALYPHRAYGIPDDSLPTSFENRGQPARLTRSIEGLLGHAREIGGAAIDAQTTIFPVLFSEGDRLTSRAGYGILADQAVNFGATLADFTGGAANRVATDLSPVVEGAARDASCLYRIALELPDIERSKVYAVTVALGDRLLPFRYTLEHLTPPEEWMRRAQAMLLSPESAEDPLFVAIEPLRRADDRWDLRLAIDVDLDRLFPIPAGDKQRRAWEVGALLYEAGSGRSWEFLDVAEATLPDEDESVRILYAQDVDRVRPGVYELRAFVRDRNDDRMAAGAVTAILPPRGAVAPPVTTVFTRTESAFATDLPAVAKSNVARPTQLLATPRPFLADPDRLDEDVRIARLTCDADEAGPPPLLDAAGAVVPAVRRKTEERGECRRVVDRYRLEPGSYRYVEADGSEQELRVR